MPPVVALSCFESISFHALRDKQRLSLVGHTLAASLQERGLDWPPADADPPGVVADLLTTYERFHGYQRLQVKDLLALRSYVRRLRETSCGLVRPAIIGDEKFAGARLLTGSSLSKASFRFLTGTALLIGLLQGPGTLLDAFPDSQELARVVSIQVRVISLEVYHDVSSLLGWDPPTLRPVPEPVPPPDVTTIARQGMDPSGPRPSPARELLRIWMWTHPCPRRMLSLTAHPQAGPTPMNDGMTRVRVQLHPQCES